MAYWSGLKTLSTTAICILAFVGQGNADSDFVAEIEGWRLWTAEYSDGTFNGCYATAEYKSGITLGLAINENYQLEVLMWNDEWSLTVDDEYSVDLSVDRWGAHRGDAWAFQTGAVSITVKDNTGLYEQLQRGDLLTISARSGEFRFDLGGTFKALDATLECTDEGVKLAGQDSADPFSGGSQSASSSDPFGGGGSTSNAPVQDPAPSANASASSGQEAEGSANKDSRTASLPRRGAAGLIDSFIEESFGQSGLEEFELSEDFNIGSNQEDHVAWVAPGVIGVGSQFKWDTDLVKHFIEEGRTTDKEECEGTFSTREKMRQGAASDKVFTIINRCDQEGGDGTMQVHSFYQVGDSLFRILHISELEDSGAVWADERLYNALIEYFSIRSL